jgi:hypothetical protein
MTSKSNIRHQNDLQGLSGFQPRQCGTVDQLFRDIFPDDEGREGLWNAELQFILTRLVAREDAIAFIRRESLKPYLISRLNKERRFHRRVLTNAYIARRF